MMQVTVKLLIQSHQPLLLFVRLVQLRELWTALKGKKVLSSEAFAD